MSGTGRTNVEGVGELTYQRAIDIARNTEGELDSTVRDYLEDALSAIWRRINLEPETYILSKDEFAVFNFFIARFNGLPVAENAIDRYWKHTGQASGSARSPAAEVSLRRASPGYELMMSRVVIPARSNQDGAIFGRSEDNEIAKPALSPLADESGQCVGHPAISLPLFAGHARTRWTRTVLAILVAFAFLTFRTIILPTLNYGIFWSEISIRSCSRYIENSAPGLLRDFQIYPPVLTVTREGRLEITDGSSDATVKLVPNGYPTCRQTLVIHSFANSYNKPFVGPYTPPSCSFNRVSWNLTVVSAGKQFDRLGIVYFGDIELFRTSTAEPTRTGIEWTYIKDMTAFLSLFKAQNQEIIFDLGNLVNHNYTAAYNVTLTASYFTADDSIVPADLIVPVSARKASENEPSVFVVPPETATNTIQLPRNVKKAAFTIAATGQIEEEFWWSNVLQSDIHTFPQYGQLYGYSPFREVQLLIDGMLAGVAWPFPIIFTGGVVPGLWKPLVGIDAFDLKEEEIDITPWLPLLCDGNAHNFTIRVSGLIDYVNGTASLSEMTDSYWWVTGKIFVWLDVEDHITTGNGPHVVTPDPRIFVSSSVGKNSNGVNKTLRYSVSAQRSLNIYGSVQTSEGDRYTTWTQELAFSNVGTFFDGGNIQINEQHTTGYDVSSNGYSRKINYPLYANSAESFEKDNITIVASLNRGKTVYLRGQLVFPTGLEAFSASEAVHGVQPGFSTIGLVTRQDGTGTWIGNQTSSKSISFGTTEQEMQFDGLRTDSTRETKEFPYIVGSEELFQRYAKAVNSTVIIDQANLVGRPISHIHGRPNAGDDSFTTFDALNCGIRRNRLRRFDCL